MLTKHQLSCTRPSRGAGQAFRLRRARSLVGFALLLLSAVTGVRAAGVWDGGGADNNWSTIENWDDNNAVKSDGSVNVHFGGSTRLTPNVDTAWEVKGLTFNSGSGAFILGGSLLTLRGDGIDQNDDDTQTINNNLTLHDNQTWTALAGDLVAAGDITLDGDLTVSGAYTTTLSGSISGSKKVKMDGTGTLIITGDNTYTGNMELKNGTLGIGSDTALGSTKFDVSDGTTLYAYGGPRTLSTLVNSHNDFTIGGSENITFNGTWTAANDLTLTVDNTGLTTIESDISGNHKLYKEGAGRLVLQGANAVKDVNVDAGVLNLQNGSALGGNEKTVVADGAALELEGGITISSEPLELTGSGIAGGGALRNVSGDNEWGGKVTLDGAATVASDADTLTISGDFETKGFAATFLGSGDITVSGVIKDDGSVTKNGLGTLTLSGANTFTGDLNINGGTLLLGASDRIVDTVNVTLGGATLATGGNSETLGTLTLTADSIIDFGDGAGVLQFADSSGIAWTSGATLTITNWSGSQWGGGTDQLLFGSEGTGLTEQQLSQIRFVGANGYLRYGMILANGEVVPVPEPATMAGIFGLLLLVAYHERHPLVRILRQLLEKQT